MHLMTPFAGAPDAGSAALRRVALPGLQRLLQRWRVIERDDGPAESLSPPHERALARVRGAEGGDGGLPWAAISALDAGVAVSDLAWGRVTPVHLGLGSDHARLSDPDDLELDDTTSRAYLDTLAPLFADAGFVMRWLGATHWLVAHESLRELPTASLDRVIGRRIEPWLPAGDAARAWRRLQNEIQMHLHEHPLSAARESAGLATVNSVWLSGCGGLSAAWQPLPAPCVDARLRAPALREDGAAWLNAWRALDAEVMTPLATAAELAARLTLCGERSAVTLAPCRSAWERWTRRRWTAHDLLESL